MNKYVGFFWEMTRKIRDRRITRPETKIKMIRYELEKFSPSELLYVATAVNEILIDLKKTADNLQYIMQNKEKK